MAATLTSPRLVLRTDAILLALAGSLALLSWFFPWFALYLPVNGGLPLNDVAQPSINSVHVGIASSPYQMATSYPHASVAAWLVFFFAIGWLGCAASCWRGRGLGWAIPITFGLAAVMFCVVYDLLGEMGVLQVFLNGHAVAPGVYTLMQLGFVPMIAALILGGIVAVRFGRVIWGRGA